MGYPFSITKEQNTKCLNELPKDELSLLQDMLNGNLFSNFTLHASYHLIWHIFTSLNEQPDSTYMYHKKDFDKPEISMCSTLQAGNNALLFFFLLFSVIILHSLRHIG